MTRQEEIRLEALKAEKEEFPRCAGDKENSFHGVNSAYGLGFVDGALWADENPKSPWISVKESLPYDNPKNIHFGFTNRVFATNGKDVFIAYMKKDKDDKWTWYTDDDNVAKILDVLVDPVTYWMLIPKIPSMLIPKLPK